MKGSMDTYLDEQDDMYIAVTTHKKFTPNKNICNRLIQPVHAQLAIN